MKKRGEAVAEEGGAKVKKARKGSEPPPKAFDVSYNCLELQRLLSVVAFSTPETDLEFSPETGLSISAISSDHVALMLMTMPCDTWGTFACKEGGHTVTLSVKGLCEILKKLGGAGKTAQLHMDTGADKVALVAFNEDHTQVTEVSIDLLSIDCEKLKPRDDLPPYGTVFSIGHAEVAYVDTLASMNKEGAVKLTPGKDCVHFSSDSSNAFAHKEGNVLMGVPGPEDPGTATLSPKAWNILAFASKILQPTLDEATAQYRLTISLPSDGTPVKAEFTSESGTHVEIYLAQKIAQ